jgi:hypothetical protein
MAALPSAVLACAQASTEHGALRSALVIVGGAALGVLGARLRVKAALLVGLVAAIAAGLGQAVAFGDLVPRWLALAVAGALLVGSGFSTERLGRVGRHALRATARMR